MVTLNQIAYAIKALKLNNTQRSIFINALANVAGGNIEEMEAKLDSLDKEMGDVKNQLDKIDISTVVLELEIGDSTEVKTRNLAKLKKVEHTFLADINYGYGTADWLPATGGQAIITTAAGGQVYYFISKDGAVSKIAENTGQVLLNFKLGPNTINDELKEVILASKTILISGPDPEYPDKIILLNNDTSNRFIGYDLDNGYIYSLSLSKNNIFNLDRYTFDGTSRNYGLLNMQTLKDSLVLDNTYVLTPKDDSFKTTGLLTFDFDTSGAQDIDIDTIALGTKSKFVIWYEGDYHSKIDTTSYITANDEDDIIKINAFVTTINNETYLNEITIIPNDSIHSNSTLLNRKEYVFELNGITDDGIITLKENLISENDFDYIINNFDTIDIIFRNSNKGNDLCNIKAIHKMYDGNTLYLTTITCVESSPSMYCINIVRITPYGEEGDIYAEVDSIYKSSSASKTSPGLVKACTNIADVTDSANLMGAFNNLLKQMRAAGMMIS